MTSSEVLILLVAIAGMLTSGWAWKEWLQSKERAHGEDVSVKLSEQETKRLELVTEAMSRNTVVAESKAAVDQFRSSIARKLKPEDKLNIDDQPIVTGDRAAEVAPPMRETAQETRVDGEFLINEVNAYVNDAHQVLRREEISMSEIDAIAGSLLRAEAQLAAAVRAMGQTAANASVEFARVCALHDELEQILSGLKPTILLKS
ncbi:hypothetical protein [Pseudohongiella spirulinae]|uniref:Uncharacterized protein n=1 Tax=Pseudohongiella spirulinae TaxID=1249552 RepID=A0A0S2KF47_9GAMM|nr:hypothetical protein [Pseudohongiella spirulinae]ALO46591.1 hypothetical protein PS2015_1948 [Pseudohongiella spirulinae]